MGCAASGAAVSLAEDPNSNSNPREPNGSSSSSRCRPKARCKIPVPWRCLKKSKRSGRKDQGGDGQEVADSETETRQNIEQGDMVPEVTRGEFLIEDLNLGSDLVDRMWSAWGNNVVRDCTSEDRRSLESKNSKSNSEDVQVDEPSDHDEHGNEISPNTRQRRNSAFSFSSSVAELESDQQEPGYDFREQTGGSYDLREVSTDRVSAGPLPPPLSEPEATRPIVLAPSAGQEQPDEVSLTSTTSTKMKFNRPTLQETIAEENVARKSSEGNVARVSSSDNSNFACRETPLASIIDDAWDLEAAPTPSCEERVSLSNFPAASDDILDEIGVVSGGCDQYLPFMAPVVEAEGASSDIAPKYNVPASSAPVAPAEGSLDTVDMVDKQKTQDSNGQAYVVVQPFQTDNSLVRTCRSKTGKNVLAATEPILANTKLLASPRLAGLSAPANLASAMAEDGGTGGSFNLTKMFDARQRLETDVDTESSPKVVTSKSAVTASVLSMTYAASSKPTTESTRVVSDATVSISTQEVPTSSSWKDPGGGIDRISYICPVYSDLQVDGPSSKEGCPASAASGTNEISHSAELSKEDAQVIVNEQVSLPGSPPCETVKTGQPPEVPDVFQAPFENSTRKSCRQGPDEKLPSQDVELPSQAVTVQRQKGGLRTKTDPGQKCMKRKTDPATSLERPPLGTLPPNTNSQVGKVSRSSTAQAIRSASRWGFARECGDHSMSAPVTTFSATSPSQDDDYSGEDLPVLIQVQTDVPATNLDTIGVARSSPYYLSEDARLSLSLRPTEFATKLGRKSERSDRGERSGLHWPQISRGTRPRLSSEMNGGHHSAPHFKNLFRWACRGISTEWGGDLPSSTGTPTTASVASPGTSSGSGISTRIGNLSSQSTPFVPDSVSEESFKQVISPADWGFEPAPQDAEAFSPGSAGHLELLTNVLTATESSIAMDAENSNVCTETNGESERLEVNVETRVFDPKPIIPSRHPSLTGESALPRMHNVAGAPLPAEIPAVFFEELRRKTFPKPPTAWPPKETLEAHPPNDSDSDVPGLEVEVADSLFAAIAAGVPERANGSTGLFECFRTPSKTVSEAYSHSSSSQQGNCEAVTEILGEDTVHRCSRSTISANRLSSMDMTAISTVEAANVLNQEIVSSPCRKSFGDSDMVNSIAGFSLAHQPTYFPGAASPNERGPRSTAVPKVLMNPSEPCSRETFVHPSPNDHAKTQAIMPATLPAAGYFPSRYTSTANTSRSSSKSQLSSDSSKPPVIRMRLYEPKPQIRGIKPSVRDAEALRFNLHRKGNPRQTQHCSHIGSCAKQLKIGAQKSGRPEISYIACKCGAQKSGQPQISGKHLGRPGRPGLSHTKF